MKIIYVTDAGETASEHQTNAASDGAASAHWTNEVAADMSKMTCLTNKWADEHRNAKSLFTKERAYVNLEAMLRASS